MKTFAIGLLSLLPLLARAQLDCIVPTREEGFEPKRPGATQLQRAARAAAAITQKNAVFMAGNKPVRVRTSIVYYGLDRLSVSVITTAYNQKAWLAGGCKISKFADRGGGLADGSIVLHINDPEAAISGRFGDHELVAGSAPERIGEIAGFPIYAPSGDARSPRALLSRSGYRPWGAVSVADMLEWRDRELRRREQDFERSLQTNGDTLDEAKIEASYRDMKKIDPALAEKTRAQMLASLNAIRTSQVRQSAAAEQSIKRQRSAFDAYRASLTPAQLRAPGRIGNAMTRDGVVRVDDPAGMAWARIDPSYALRDPARIHIIVVSLAPQPKTDPEYAWQQASYQALDYAELARLLSE